MTATDNTDADLATAATAQLNLYGQKTQPLETPEFLSTSQTTLLTELDKLDTNLKSGYNQALTKYPNLINEQHKLMFLRCEVFNAHLAAIRLCKYWNRRFELFGDRAFSPIHLGEGGALCSTHGLSGSNEDAKSDTMVQYTLKGIYLGFVRSTQTYDDGGRAILFVDPSKLANGYNKSNEEERLGVARALWYVLHDVIEGNDDVQKLGMVVIAYPHHASIKVIDRKLMKMNMESISGCIPVRMGGFHVIQPPWFFDKIIFPIMKIVMPERMRKRVNIHSGTEERVLERLEKFGLGKDVLPSEIGGDVVLDTDSWVKDMKSEGL